MSDPTGTLATPVGVVERPATRRGLARLAALAAEVGAERVVVGLPLSLHGGDSAQTRGGAGLRRPAGRAPAASRSSSTTSASRPRWRSARGGSAEEDARAAAHLLEGWLERHRTAAP